MHGEHGEGVRLTAYTYCLKRHFLLSKNVRGGGVTFERTYFMDDPIWCLKIRENWWISFFDIVHEISGHPPLCKFLFVYAS